MKNTKNTRVQKQQKKAKKQRRISSTLMCGLVLSGVALPAVAVLADNAIQSQTPASTQSSTVKTAQDTPAPVVANPDSGKDGSAEFAPPLDSADPNTPAPTLSPETPAPTTKQATEKHKAIIHFVNSVSGESIKADMTVEGTVEQDIRSVAGKDAFKVPGYVLTEEPNTFYPFNADWVEEYTAFYTPEGYEAPDDGFVLGTDGYYHQKHDNGEINYNVRFADFNITYVDKATGKTLGTDAQGIKEAGTGTSSTTYGHGFSENTWAIADGDSKWIDPNSSFDYDGKTYYSGIYVYTDRSQDGSTGDVVSPVNGQINVTVPLTDITKTDPAENVTFKTRYVDDATGKDIAPAETDTLPVGGYYSASALDIPHYKLNSAKDVNFTVQKGQKDVIFHYIKDQASYVEFKLVDAKTNKENGTVVKHSGQEGQWTSIDPTSKEFKIDGYTMQKSYYLTSGLGTQTYDYPAPGKTNSVTVKYDKDSDQTDAKKGTLTVRYTDTSGNEIKDPTTQDGKVGDLYEVVAPDIKGWKLNDNCPNLYRDEYKEGNTTVTFKYDKDETPDPVKQGSVTVQYVDQDGKAIKEAKTLKGDVDSKFEESAPTIKGYKLTSDKTVSGKFADKAQTVKFNYKKDAEPVAKSTITVKYVDEKGTEIQKSTSKQGNSGDKFQMSTKELEIKGYDLKSKAIDTTFGDKDKTITVEYTKHVDPVKQGSVTFKYVDKDSKELQASKTIKGDVGKAFEEKAPTIKGYSLDKSKSDETYSGKFTEKGQTYYFVYNKDVTPTPDPQPEDSKLRPVLEQAIKDAKPYSDKAKYQAKYVDALDKAISDAEAFLKANPAPNAKARALKAESTDLDSKFQAQIDNVTTAVNNVKANPVTPTPDEDVVKITFNLYDKDSEDAQGNLKLLKTVVLDASKKEIDANGGHWDATKHKDELAVDGYTYVSGLGTLMEIDTTGAPNEFPVLYAKNTPNPTPDPVKQGSVTFKYVDKDSKELQASKTIKGDVGKAFEEKAPSIKGYKLDTTKSEETYKGKYTELGQTYYFVYVGDGSTPSNTDNNNPSDNNSDNNNAPSDNNESGKTVPPTAPEGSYYDDNGNLLNKDGVLIDSKGTPLTSDQSKNTLKVDNTKNKNGLPETGESSPFLMTLSGLGVLMASVLAFIVKRKPKRD
ncbi:MucBP domain-containing protein [Lactococcus lactis]|uniref:MucBP domain-containing protein n=1 Tax=Lactococcus lactis TaxID=1358 RepID=UPI00288C66A7|nr:MucBP domain-containing protein [Lactococcus lactis]MDT2866848.1 MucBP domain-containing protein [Lactococcus lactis]